MGAPSRPSPSEVRARFALDPDVRFLNHGSFGACPRPVLEAQARLRAQMEAEPVRFFVRELAPLLDAAREEVAAFVGADPANLVFVRNATAGVNAVLRSLRFAAGDELLLTSHGYNACNNVARFVAERDGARVVVAELPFVGATEAGVREAILRAVTPHTRLALVDHVTSPTGLVLPIADIVRDLAARGVETLVDGAHGPGMLPLDLERLGAAYYTGNFHKWCCAPKGAALLWVRPDRQAGIHPAVLSHGYNLRGGRSPLHAEFDWPGTDDPTPWLCVPEALRFVASLSPDGWDGVRAANRALALEARDILCEALGVAPPAPDAMIGFLAALPLPDGSPTPPTSALYLDPLQLALYEEHRIEVPVPPWPAPPRRLVRVSAQLYNERAEYEACGAALRALLARGL